MGVASLVAVLLVACGGGGGGGNNDGGGGDTGGGGTGGGGGGGTGGGGTGGGGGGGGGAGPQSYTVGGTVSGLSGAGLVLQLNGGDDLSLTSSGNFNFATALAGGANYTVSIRTQPSNPTQTCVLSNLSGTIGSANVTNVSVACTTAYTVGGTVSGLSVDAGLVLQLGNETLSLSRNGSFVFATGLPIGAAYNVTVNTQPTAPVQNCTVTNASGTMSSAGVADVVVSCDGIALLAGALGGRGSIDGVGAAARFSSPFGIATDPDGNMFVADGYNNTIRKITPAGVVSTFAGLAGVADARDGNGSVARFFTPRGIATDVTGNVYVADTDNHTIRKITPAGLVSTLAGAAGVADSVNGSGTDARFASPYDIARGPLGTLYVADTYNHTIRRITPAGVVSTVAGTAGMPGFGNGSGSAVRFDSPSGLAVDAAGNAYVADTNNHTIRKVTPGGVVTTFAGVAGQAGSSDEGVALFNHPQRVKIDSAGNVLVADSDNHTIRSITPAGVVSTLAGAAGVSGAADGSGNAARFLYPSGVTVDSTGNAYVSDSINGTIRKITSAGVVSTFAGAASLFDSVDGSGPAARFTNPSGVATDSAGNVYVADSYSHTIRKITAAGVVSTLAGTAHQPGDGDGIGAAARFTYPSAIAIDSAGNVWVADTGNHTIRKITPAGVVSTVAGMAKVRGSDDGSGSVALFDSPYGIATDSSSNVYVADTRNHTIRKITPAGVVSTLAGTAQRSGFAEGSGALFNSPAGLDVDSAGNVYVADSENQAIRKITPAGVVSTVAGTAGVRGSDDVSGLFNTPYDVVVDSAGNVYVADQFNNTIRRIAPDGTVTTVAGTPGSSGVRLGPLPGSLSGPRYIALLPGPRVTLVTGGETGVLLITLP